MRLESADHWENEVVRLEQLTTDGVTDEYVSWLNDPEVNRYLESRFVRHDREGVTSYVNSVLESPTSLLLAIYSNALDCHVGNIKLGPIDRYHCLGEIGLLVGLRASWGKGIATNAIAVISRIGFEQLGLRKLTAGCYSSNKGSQIAFERAGFGVEAVRRNHFVSDGGLEDLVLLARFADGHQEAMPATDQEL